MEINNFFILRETAKFLDNRYSGFFISEILTQEKSKLHIVISKNDDKSALEFSADSRFAYMIARKNFSKAKKNSVQLLKQCNGKTIKEIKLKGDDRIIEIFFSDDSKLAFTFIPSLTNCFYIQNEIIIDTFKDTSEFADKNFDKILPQKAETQDLKTVKDLMKKYSDFGKQIQSEVLQTLNLKSEERLDSEFISRIELEFERIGEKLNTPQFILYRVKNDLKISLLNVDNRFDEYEEYEDINSLLINFIKGKSRREIISSAKDKKANEIEKKIAKQEKLIDGLQRQLEHGKNSNRLKQFGELLYANLSNVKKGDRELIAVDEKGEQVLIKLKQDLSPSENAEYYFAKYKKQKASVDILNKKIESALTEKKKLIDEFESVKRMKDEKQILKMSKENERDKADSETSRFRKFPIGDYEVWVGKDSVSNDLLTMKHSAHNDLWFHVRGASGSHTVLKTGNQKANIDKRIIEKAASIAAYYSKARNASSVPVAYCERKYVKKKKGMKSGSVIMEREKVVFVKPQLPEELST